MTLSSDEKKVLVEHRFNRSRETLKEGLLLYENRMLSAAVNRIYYSMFYALSAFALSKGYKSGKHGQLIGWFNKNFVKPGKVEIKYSKIILRAFNKRMDGDYEDFSEFLEAEVMEMLSESNEFIEKIEQLLMDGT